MSNLELQGYFRTKKMALLRGPCERKSKLKVDFEGLAVFKDFIYLFIYCKEPFILSFLMLSAKLFCDEDIRSSTLSWQRIQNT